MKSFNFYFVLFVLSVFICSCSDEGKLPIIALKTGGSYITSDTLLPAGSPILIGITAAKAESKDVLKKFDISKSVNGSAANSIYNKDLSGSEGDNYNYDFRDTLSLNAGQINKLTFTVTNRDGLLNQINVSLTTR